MNKYAQLHKDNGPLVSTKFWSDADRTDTEVHYQHREKAECALVAMSSWYGGDVFEFGAHDLNTGRNLLTALDISGMAKGYPDTQFYFFDAFGKFPDMGHAQTEYGIDLTAYFKPYSDQGDQIARHEAYLDEHGLFRDRCHLVQGLFGDTCSPEFKSQYGNRKIGFASLDCNIAWSYKTVFEFIFDMMAESSYIYMDEGLQSPEVMYMWKIFSANLQLKRKIDVQFIRNAGGFGSLWRLYPMVESPLEL